MHQKRHSFVFAILVFTLLVSLPAVAAPRHDTPRRSDHPVDRVVEVVRRLVIRAFGGGDISIPKP